MRDFEPERRPPSLIDLVLVGALVLVCGAFAVAAVLGAFE